MMINEPGLPEKGTKTVRATGWTAGEREGELVRPLLEDRSGYRTMLMQVEIGRAHV